MSERISRREMLSRVAGLATGAGLALVQEKAEAEWLGEFPRVAVSVKTSPPGPKSIAMLERMRKVIGRTNYSGLYGITLEGGQGAYVTDLDGNIYLDCLSAATTNVLGYGHDEVALAYYQTATQLQNSCFPYSANIQAIELAEKLTRITPGRHAKKVLIGLSGSDSCDGAIEAMRKYTGRYAVIKFANAYHGSTGLSQQASGFRGLNDGIYPPSPNFITVDFPVTLKQRDEVLRRIKTLLTSGEIGGVLAEPIQGDAGVQVPPEGFFPLLAEMLSKHQALFIIDEIQSGMGRTGRWWAIEHDGVVPDILVTAKGLSGGYAPISALIGRAEVIDALHPAQHLFTYTGHPPSAAAAAKVISIIEDHDVMANADKLGCRLLGRLQALQLQYPDVLVEARGRGLMIGLEINISRDPAACKLFAMRCVEKGVYVGYFGNAQQVVRIEPPLILTEEQTELVADVCAEVAKEMHSGRIPASTREKVRNFAIGL
ncbi:aspartate aminotransferase family protein [Methylococcus sp. EFPC2]|uniref:aspartate aminotransferase family protein n=1 Tax=Methylococcus sp. EFPC2 TaxID=2812648 RepID=UPI001966FB12|nr:aminotransferase class III-fold pyridoxal phosphate-dependent enzyme [Methylococcus sp. EFPC2]QSA96800.1 aminotransferase class III-fold pyridoxal phosphate-dependent enzyme [Methylococcus sp. EFPC2]